MAFVEQGAKQRMPSCFPIACDLSNKSFIASSSTLEKHKDTNVQAPRAPDCLSKGSTANEPTLQLASSSAIPHWMSTKQVQNILIDTSLKTGSTGNVVPFTVHEPLGSFCPLPSPKLGFGSEGKTNFSIGIESRDDLVDSRHLFQQQLPERPPLSVCLTPSLSFNRDGQKEEPKISKEDALSFFLHKQEKQPAKECLTDLPTLSLGHSGGQLSHQRADVSSWVSKFPFQIASNSEQAERGQLIQHRENLGRILLTNAKSECGVVNIPSQLMGSRGHIDQCKFLMQHSLSSTGAANDVLPQSLANSPLNSPWPLPATISGSTVPSLKRNWNATLMQGVKHAQLLPDFFAQQKVMVVAKASQSHFAKSEDTEMTSKVSFSQKSLASRVSEDAGFNFPSLHGSFCSDSIRNSSVDHTSIKKQEMDNGGEAVKRRIPSSEQNLQDILRQVDLLRVKHETLSKDSETRESTEKRDKITTPEGRVLTEALSLSSGLAVDQAPSSVVSGINGMVGKSQAAELMLFRDVASTEVSTIVSAGVPSLPFLKHSPNLKGENVPANKYAPLDGDWGDFLAAPSIRQTAEIDGKLMLPFQQRFEQLQKFLKKCDGSDEEYCLRAIWSLSGSARGNHPAELESRAIRLSLEEGKEMKRARLLNVLEEFPEGAYVNPYARPMAPWFSASTVTAVLKEAA